jgi:iron complex transport system permease protein
MNRFRLTVGLLLLGILVLTILHVGLGKASISPREVLEALFGGGQGEHPTNRHIVWNLRLPRALIGVVAGAMLGMAGAILQTIMRNPLVEPGLIGASSGCVLFAVLWMTYGAGVNTGYSEQALLPFVALAGGVCAVIAVYLINGVKENSTARLALTGVIMTAILQSATSLVLLKNQQGLATVFLWNFGSLNGRVWTQWNMLWPWALFGIPLAMVYARKAGLLQFGDATAIGVGLPVRRTRITLLILAAGLTAASVSVVGAIGFIGLIGPHIAALLVGRKPVYLFPISALFSAMLLVSADWIGQSLTLRLPIPGMENHLTSLPVGAVTTLMGAPFFLYLLRKQLVRKR